MTTMAAVDLGASSGRVISGTLDKGRISMVEAARFGNGPIRVPTTSGQRLHWDILRLWGCVTEGLRSAAHGVGALASVGIDSWAVDYGLLDSDGALLGNPASYRCERTKGAPERFFETLSAAELYAKVGLQVQPFNTLFQLSVESPLRMAAAETLLLIPDLLGYWLTSRPVAEATNASTTGLLDPMTRQWRRDVVELLGGSFGRPVQRLLPELVEAGELVGPITGLELSAAEALPAQLVAVGSHDTASAVVAVPAERDDFAYISCGTWSLVGLELSEPVLTEAARVANLTNELGIDGTVRFLKNVMGLWVFNESVRTWRAQHLAVDVAGLIAAAAEVPARQTVLDIDDPLFFAPGDMPARIQAAALDAGQAVPASPAEVTRVILDSLALAYRRSLRQAASIAGREVGVVHLVGGGAQNRLLCQLTADAAGLSVVAGPVEATALGNLVVQARACALIEGGLPELRAVVRASAEVERYEPRPGSEAAWQAAERRIFYE